MNGGSVRPLRQPVDEEPVEDAKNDFEPVWPAVLAWAEPSAAQCGHAAAGVRRGWWADRFQARRRARVTSLLGQRKGSIVRNSLPFPYVHDLADAEVCVINLGITRHGQDARKTAPSVADPSDPGLPEAPARQDRLRPRGISGSQPRFSQAALQRGEARCSQISLRRMNQGVNGAL
jgi:hypothetical protein